MLNGSRCLALAHTALLNKVLAYHVIPARVPKAVAPIGAAEKSLQGDRLAVHAAPAITGQRGRKASNTGTDGVAGSGVTPVIDKVIRPRPKARTAPTAFASRSLFQPT